MGQTLSHGVYLPNEGERNCYAGLASNWQILNTAVGNIAEKAPLVHTHGNITNDGKVGTTANLPLITGTGGAITAGAFGTSANTFCEGNDSRLSDARTPVAHTHTKADVTDLLNSNFIPSANNSYDLGTSTNKWKTLNGINPGALSLPKTGSTANTDYTDVLGNITVIDPDTRQPYTDEQTFVAPATGWLVMWFAYNKITSCMAWLDDCVRACLSGTFTAGYPGITLPVIAGETVHLRINATQIAGARLYYCQGNV